MNREKIASSYNKTYKIILLVPIALLFFSLIYLFIFYNQTGDIIRKDVSLTGGTTVTVFDKNVSATEIKSKLISEFPDIFAREISDIGTGGQKGFFVETKAEVDLIKPALEKALGYELNNENSSIEFSGATLSAGFYKQLINSIVSAFLLMAWVVFLIFSDSRKIKGIFTIFVFFAVGISLGEISAVKFVSIIAIIVGTFMALFVKGNGRKEYLTIGGLGVASLILIFVYPSYLMVVLSVIALSYISFRYSIPSFAVILSAFADIIMTLAVVNIFGMSLSSAGIIAFLMLIGYSVDTDILLTSRLLKKKEGSLNERMFGAFKTGMTMTLTSIAAVLVSLIIIYNLSETLRQIFTILLIGLFFDMFNTWFTNASMLKWYMGVKKIQ